MFKMIVSLAIAAQLVGCATQPATQSAAADSGGNAAMTTATTPVATTTPAKPTAPPGYKTRIRDGETVFCTKVQPTGSLFPQDVCYTPEQLETLTAQQKRAADRLLNKPVGCRAEGCVTGQ